MTTKTIRPGLTAAAATPDDYWAQLADSLHQAADKVAALAGTPKPLSGVSLTVWCGLSKSEHETTRPIVDAVATAFGTTAQEAYSGGWRYRFEHKVGALDVAGLAFIPAPEDRRVAELEAELAALRAQVAAGGAR